LEWLFLSCGDGYREYAGLSHKRDVIRERWRQKKRLGRLRDRKRDDWADNPHKNKNKNKNKNSISSTNADHGSNPASESESDNPNNNNNNNPNKNNSKDYQVKHRAGKSTHYLTPGVVEFNARRLPADIIEYAMAGDLSEQQLEEYEQKLLDLEGEEELEFSRLREEMIVKQGRGGGVGSGGRRGYDADIEDQQQNNNNRLGLSRDKFILPPRLSRFFYFGFQQGEFVKEKTSAKPTTPNTQETIRRIWKEGRSKLKSTMQISSDSVDNNSDASPPPPQDLGLESVTNNNLRVNHHLNRHLKSTSISDIRPLTTSDREMLRCIGLDYFVMIRFLRFCFDVTFYPFLASCVILLPTYITNPYDGINNTNEEVVINEQTEGYFRFTINRLEPSSDRLWAVYAFAFVFYCFVLRRLWIEWETFIVLRFEFLANGDADYEEALAAASRPNDFKKRRRKIPKKDDIRLHLEQFRNSCIVEYIPESHRRDQELFQFFDSVFPGQVRRAEIMINTPELSDLIDRRQAVIELYEQVYAKHSHEKQKYSQKRDWYLMKRNRHHTILDRCCLCNKPRKPHDPTMQPLADSSSSSSSSLLRRCCCCYELLFGENKVNALPHLLSVIKKLNREVENEYRTIVDEKQSVDDRDAPMHQGFLDAKVAGAKTFFTGVGEELKCSTGFVEFTTLTAKQSALQCNLTGTTRYMVTTSAPDPRDVVWENATVEHKTTSIKKIQCDGLLFVGTLFWSVVVSAVTSISDLDLISQYMPAGLVPDVETFWYDLIQGYLPVVLLEGLMKLLTIILGIIARRFIRFKTNSEVDRFVFKWHLAYRVANLVIIIVNRQLLKTINLLRTNPQAAMDSLVTSIAFSSQFFLNNMIVAAGTELLLELAQIPKMLYHFVLHKCITVEATSKRILDKLKVPEGLEWGETFPPFIFGLIIAMVYSTLVPIVTGVCSVYFYLATKVYTHQSLFVYAQPYEGGGMIMYELNRSIFVIIYISIAIFSILFNLKTERIMGLLFGIGMITMTMLVDIKIRTNFIKPSITLALTNARIIDEENARCQELSRQYQEYKAAKREKKKREVKNKLANSPATLNVKFKHDVDEEKSFDVGKSYIPSSLKNNTSASPLSLSRRVQFEKPGKRSSSQVPGGSGGKPSTLTLASSNTSADNSNDNEDFYLYRQPQLNKALWETTPRTYWD